MAATTTNVTPESISFMPVDMTSETGRVSTVQLALVGGNLVTRKNGNAAFFMSAANAARKVESRVKQGRFVLGAKILTAKGNLSKAGKAVLSDSGFRLSTKAEVKAAQAAKAERAAQREAAKSQASEATEVVSSLQAQIEALKAQLAGASESSETEAPEAEVEVGEEDDLDCI